VTPAVDPNMAIALCLANGLTHGSLELPSALVPVEARVALMLQIDKPLLVDVNGVAQWEDFGSQLRAIAEASASQMAKLSSELDRVAVALTLWSGCIMAAKSIAMETRSGQNTSTGRTQQFTLIDNVALQNKLFSAGVEAAPSFKAARGEEISLDGVPDTSPVRRHVDRIQGGA
jgi:hypothetical protein